MVEQDAVRLGIAALDEVLVDIHDALQQIPLTTLPKVEKDYRRDYLTRKQKRMERARQALAVLYRRHPVEAELTNVAARLAEKKHAGPAEDL